MRRDFDPRGGLPDAAYAHRPPLIASGFADLTHHDQTSFRRFGSKTPGVHLVGTTSCSEKISFAQQTDLGNDPDSYAAHYVYLEGGPQAPGSGRVSGGYEQPESRRRRRRHTLRHGPSLRRSRPITRS